MAAGEVAMAVAVAVEDVVIRLNNISCAKTVCMSWVGRIQLHVPMYRRDPIIKRVK